MLELPAFLKGLCIMAPFMTTAHGAPKLNIARMAEGVLIAAVTSLVTMWGTQQVMAHQLATFEATLKVMSIEVKEAREVQLRVVPKRDLQVQNLQDTDARMIAVLERHETRLTKLESRRGN